MSAPRHNLDASRDTRARLEENEMSHHTVGRVDADLVWVNPIEGSCDRTILESKLRLLAEIFDRNVHCNEAEIHDEVATAGSGACVVGIDFDLTSTKRTGVQCRIAASSSY